MIIAEIRSYFDQQVKTVDATLERFKTDIFADDDIPSSMSDKFYKLSIAPNGFSPSRTGSEFFDIIPVQLVIFTKRTRSVETTYDAALEKALCLRVAICNPQTIYALEYVNDIECINIQPEQLPDNDNVFALRLDFNVRQDFSY